MNVYRVTATTDQSAGSLIVTATNADSAIAYARLYIPVRHDVRDSVKWNAEFLAVQGQDYPGNYDF